MAGIGKGAAHRHVIMQCILVRDRGFSAQKNVPAAWGNIRLASWTAYFKSVEREKLSWNLTPKREPPLGSGCN